MTTSQFKLLEEAKLRYPVGTFFKNMHGRICMVDDDLSKPDKHSWFTESYLIIHIKDINGKSILGIGEYIYRDGKWSEIVSQPEINTYGLKVGDELPVDVLMAWTNNGNNYYTKKWCKVPSCFLSNRKILSFELKDNILGFLVSETVNVYLKAEGFKEFMDNFNKPKKNSFPLEGCVYNNVINLSSIADYLLKRPFNRSDNKITKHEAIGIAWNQNSCWWLKTKKSEKKEYSLSYLKDVLNNNTVSELTIPSISKSQCKINFDLEMKLPELNISLQKNKPKQVKQIQLEKFYLTI